MNSNNSKAEIQLAEKKSTGIIRCATLSILAGAIFILFLGSLNLLAQGSSVDLTADTGGNKSDSNLKSVARVNPSTLAMEFSLPIFTYPGRAGNNVPLSYNYSSKVWQMKHQLTWWYSTGNNHPRYVTDLYAQFAEKSAAGWTSSLLPPRIEEKELEVYDQHGKSFNFLFDVTGVNDFYSVFVQQNSLNESNESNFSIDPVGGCGTYCSRWVYQCPPWMNGICTESQAAVVCGGMSLDTSGCSWNTGGGGAWNNYQPPYPNNTPAKRSQYIKRIQVQMPSGSMVEFRKDDKIHGYCVGTSPSNPGNCEQVQGATRQGADREGDFLAVDGSGMRLHRAANESILYLPNGGRYIFPNLPLHSGSQWYASKYIDADGNISTFSQTEDLETNEITNKWIDTLGQEIIDLMPQNWGSQTQKTGTQTIEVPGLNNSTREYKVKWLKLKGSNAGDSALENPSQELSYETNKLCRGFPSDSLPPTGNTANGVLFNAESNSGIRTCSSFLRENDTIAPALFNPTVLAEVELPNGQKYQFRYNQYGEITKIVYPTGIYEKFAYAQITPLGSENNFVYDQTNRGVVTREFYAINDQGQPQLQQRWQYSAGYGPNPTYPLSSNDYKVTTIASNPNNPSQTGMKTETILIPSNDPPPFSLTGNYGFSEPRAGMPKEERTYDELNQLRSRTINDYIVALPRTQSENQNGVYDERATRDPRLSKSVTLTFEPGATHALATLSKTIYDAEGSDPAFFSHLNIKRTEGYHYVAIEAATAQNPALGWSTIDGWFPSSKLASVSETDYEYNPDYKTHGIISLPKETRVLNPQNQTQIIARTQTIYDNAVPAANPAYPYSVQTYSGVASPYKCSSDTQIDCWSHSNASSLSYRGKPTTSRVWDNDNNIWIESHTQFDQFGNAVKAKDAIGNEVQTIFTASNKFAYPEVLNTSAPGDGTHGTTEGSTASTTYDFKTGLPLTSTNDFGQTVMTEYNDPLLRPTKIQGVGNYAIPIVQTIYDDVPAVSLDVNGSPIGDGDPISVKVRKQIDTNNWDESETFMDSLGRTIKNQTKDSQGDVFIETQYDFAGRVKAISNPYRQGDMLYWSKPRYDELGRAVESFAPAQAGQTGASLGVTSYAISTITNFVGTVVTTTDASGRKGRSITNALGQLLRVDEPQNIGGTDTADLGDLATPLQPTFYTYDERGNLKEVNQGGQIRTFTYDSFSRIKTATNPESGTVNYTYDILGNLKTKRDARGNKTIYDYDKANRIINRCYRIIGSGALGATNCASAGSETIEPNTPDVSYFYDGKGLTNQQSPNYAKGKLTKISSSASETLYTNFDDHGRVLTHQQITDGQTYSTSYKYDFTGALIEQTYPSGKIVRNFYDTDGDLSQVVKNGKNYASDFSFTAAGAIQKMRLGNGNWESAVYNERLQPTQIGLGNAPNNTANLWKVNYEYGELNTDGTTVNAAKNNGNIAKQIITVPTVGTNQGFTATQSYTYDSINRLKQAKETIPNQTGWQQTFDYDRFGNRSFIEADTTTLTKACLVNAAPAVCENDRKLLNPIPNQSDNRLKIGDDYEYDANGNLTKDAEGKRFTYDALNKQTEVKNSSNQSLGRYVYDGEGKRIKKLGNVESTVFVYDAFGSLIAEYTIDNFQPNPAPNTSFLTADTLGSPRIVTGKSGEVLSRRDFLPFGEEIIANETNRKSALGYNYSNGNTTRQSFTGYEKDVESDLEFAENRYYSNRLGRFTTPDPMMASGKAWNPQTWNRYAYVNNNPLNSTDPLGLDPEKQAWWYTPCSGCRPVYGTGYTSASQLIVPARLVYLGFDNQWWALNPLKADSYMAFANQAEAAKWFAGVAGSGAVAAGFTVVLEGLLISGGVTTGAILTAPFGDAEAQILQTAVGTRSDDPTNPLNVGSRLVHNTLSDWGMNPTDYVINSNPPVDLNSSASGGVSMSNTASPNPDPNKPNQGPSGKKSTEKYLEKRWDKASFGNTEKSIEYHYKKHVTDKGRNESVVQYTQQAVKNFNARGARIKNTTDSQGRPALKVSSKYGSGLYTKSGKIIWFESR